jgi:uncharacterized membrane protein YtjA (UPF0391 family)
LALGGEQRRGSTPFNRCDRARWNLVSILEFLKGDVRPIFGDATMGNLLHYAIVFLVVALIAAAVGFGGVAGFAMEAARLLFWVFIVLFVISLIAGLVKRA